MRARVAAMYVGHDENSTPVTVLKPGWLVSYAHGQHEEWTVGTIVTVSVDMMKGRVHPNCINTHCLSVHQLLAAWQVPQCMQHLLIYYWPAGVPQR
jgi:hypothetical protein